MANLISCVLNYHAECIMTENRSEDVVGCYCPSSSQPESQFSPALNFNTKGLSPLKQTACFYIFSYSGSTAWLRTQVIKSWGRHTVKDWKYTTFKLGFVLKLCWSPAFYGKCLTCILGELFSCRDKSCPKVITCRCHTFIGCASRLRFCATTFYCPVCYE